MKAFYNSITRYTQEDKPLVAHATNVENNKLKSLVGGLGGRKKSNDYVSDKNDKKIKHRYFKAQFLNDSMTSLVSQKYGEDYYLFINHFEMETRYKDCHDMANNAFQRDMYVHYTLIDANNKFVDGGVVMVTFQSSDKQIDDILPKNLDILASLITKQIKTKI